MNPEDKLDYHYEDDNDYEFDREHRAWDDEDGWPEEEY